MVVPDVTGGGAIPMLERTLAFNEARQRMLATNIANITTPGYRARQLDVSAFRAALREAAERREAGNGPLEIWRGQEFAVDGAGRLRVTPSEAPVENALFQDGTNASIERQMSALAETAMTHQVTAELLKGYYDNLAKAIRGRVA